MFSIIGHSSHKASYKQIIPILSTEGFIDIKEFLSSELSSELDLTGYNFNTNFFNLVSEKIKKSDCLKRLIISGSLLTHAQRLALHELVAIKKGLQLIDSEGQKIGPAYVDWSNYNNAKFNAWKRGMTPIAKEALDRFLSDYGRLPYSVLDFGAGTGQDTINAALEGCPYILAIDSDADARIKFLENIKEIEKNRKIFSEIRYELSPFLEQTIEGQYEFFMAIYTWPYRLPRDFPAVWKKTLDALKPGGYVVGHFFGPTQNPDPSMTYHTKAEVQALLEKDFDNIHIQVDPENHQQIIYGGKDKPWGELYHVYAKKRT